MKRMMRTAVTIALLVAALSGCEIIEDILGIDLTPGDDDGNRSFIVSVTNSSTNIVGFQAPIIVALVNVNMPNSFVYRSITTGNGSVTFYESEIPAISPSGYAVAVLHDLNNNFSTNRTNDPGEVIGWYKMGAPGSLVYSDEPGDYTPVYPGASLFTTYDPPATATGDAFEPDNTWADASWMSIGTSEAHTLTPGDIDWGYFDVAGGVGYTVETFSSGAGDDADTYLSVYAADGTTLIGFDDDSNGFFSRVSFIAPADGEINFTVEDFYGEPGTYAVGVYLDGVSSSAIDPDTPYLASISSAGEFDWYTFDAVAGTTYTIQTYSAAGTDVDTILAVYSETFGQLALNDDRTDISSTYSLIEYTAAYTGMHYVRVTGFGGTDTGDYNLEYTAPTTLDVTIE